jgi:phospholipid transport system substrate-binding protein|tara:strand:+ start:2126 stop:2776 length:651 start_codon:yes stop_codon:yes gene_type:complete
MLNYKIGKYVSAVLIGFLIILLSPYVLSSSNEWRHGETQEEDPKILISGIMHSAVLELRSEEEIDPHELVERILMPHVDVLKMSKLILGRNWNYFTIEQQEEFAFLFETTLNKMYAAYLLEYKDTMALTFRSTGFNTNRTRANVHMILHLSATSKVHTRFLLYVTEGNWKIYNFSIDGINFGIIYRNTYKQLINNLGIDGTLEQMREKLNNLETAT